MLPDATAIGAGRRLPAGLAAFVNGVLAHSLDYDDTHLPSILHPSASVVPGRARPPPRPTRRSGAELVPAVAVGLEVAVRLGMAGYDRSSGSNIWFDRGQHATSICGTIGSAAAAAKLMRPGLRRDRRRDGGGRVDGLGHHRGEPDRWHGQATPLRLGGPGRCHCRGPDRPGPRRARRRSSRVGSDCCGRSSVTEREPEEVVRGLSDDPAANDWCVADIFYKPYPANHYTHCGIDAAIQLRDGGLRAEDVESAHLGVAGATVRTIGEPIDVKQAPDTGYQAQFSGPYTVAAALLGGGGLGLGLADFADELVVRPDAPRSHVADHRRGGPALRRHLPQSVPGGAARAHPRRLRADRRGAGQPGRATATVEQRELGPEVRGQHLRGFSNGGVRRGCRRLQANSTERPTSKRSWARWVAPSTDVDLRSAGPRPWTRRAQASPRCRSRRDGRDAAPRAPPARAPGVEPLAIRSPKAAENGRSRNRTRMPIAMMVPKASSLMPSHSTLKGSPTTTVDRTGDQHGEAHRRADPQVEPGQ